MASIVSGRWEAVGLWQELASIVSAIGVCDCAVGTNVTASNAPITDAEVWVLVQDGAR